MDPLEWLVRLSDHIPDPGQHRTLFYGEYSSRVRGSGASAEPEVQAGEEHQPRKLSLPSWGRLIAKVYQVDPLLCTRCDKRMSLIAFVTDQLAIGKILDHLGLSTPEAEKPPPPVRSSASPSRATAGACRHSGSQPEPLKSPPDRVRPHAALCARVFGRYRGGLERRASP